MRIIVGLIIDKNISLDDDIKLYRSDIETYINHVDKLLIFNTSGYNLNQFYVSLAKYQNIYISNQQEMGQVEFFKLVLDEAIKDGADFVSVMRLNFFYEEGSFLAMKRYLIENEVKPSVLSPMPLYTCIENKRTKEEARPIKGCRLWGTLINVVNYQASAGFFVDYYQTTFDYDYCLSERHKGNEVILMPNVIMRDRQFIVLERRIFFIKHTSYDRDLLDIYYETRNRYYLWDKYKKIDPDYVKLDKKIFKAEKKDMRLAKFEYQEKVKFMLQAQRDFKNGKMGKADF